MYFFRLAILAVMLSPALACAAGKDFSCPPALVRVEGLGCQPLGGLDGPSKLGDAQLDIMSGDPTRDPYFSDVEAPEIQAATERSNMAATMPIDCSEEKLLCAQSPRQGEKECPYATERSGSVIAEGRELGPPPWIGKGESYGVAEAPHLRLPFKWGPPVEYGAAAGYPDRPLRVTIDHMVLRLDLPMQVCAEVEDGVSVSALAPVKLSLKGKGRAGSEVSARAFRGDLHAEGFNGFDAFELPLPQPGEKAKVNAITGRLRLKNVKHARIVVNGAVSLENVHAEYVRVEGDLHLENSTIDELVWNRRDKWFYGSCTKEKGCWGRIRNWVKPSDVWRFP